MRHQVTTYRTDLNRGWLNAVENSGVVDGRIEYSYDAAGNKTSVESVAIKDGVEQKNKTLFRYDALGRTDLVTFSDATTTRYGYDQVGNRETITRSNGANTLYRYDNQYRLTYQQHSGTASSNAPIFSTFSYTVRADGKRTGVREQVSNPLNSSVAMTTRSIAYDFDGAGRLTRETREERQSLRAGGETSSTRIAGYEFDEVSNRKKLTTNSYNGIGADRVLVTTSNVDYAYNAADELTEEVTTVGANTTSKTYAYDDNGAQTSISANGVVTPYSYDFEGKLVEVGDSTSSTRSWYLYDGDGNRLSAIVTTGGVAKTVRYLNDTNTAYVQVVEERDENGVLQARYDNGDGDTQKLYRRDKDTGLYLTRWYLNDGLESTRQLVDANSVVTDSYAYDAFGSTLQRAGQTENTRLYNGQQQDDTGLYFLRARYMDMGTGRFLNHDPILGDSDDPVTLHRYLYANADPVNNVDPTGLFSMTQLVVTGVNLMGRTATSLSGAAYGAAFGAAGDLAGQHLGNLAGLLTTGETEEIDRKKIFMAAGVGAAAGYLTPLLKVRWMAMLLGGIANGVENALQQYYDKDFDPTAKGPFMHEGFKMHHIIIAAALGAGAGMMHKPIDYPTFKAVTKSNDFVALTENMAMKWLAQKFTDRFGPKLVGIVKSAARQMDTARHMGQTAQAIDDLISAQKSMLRSEFATSGVFLMGMGSELVQNFPATTPVDIWLTEN